MDAETTAPTNPAIAEPTPPSGPAPADPSAGVPFPPPPILELDRLALRPLHARDAPVLARRANDPGVAGNMSNRFPYPYTEAAAAAWLAGVVARSDHDYAICTRENHAELLGVIGIRPHGDVEWRTRELGYWIARECWGKGYMSEAARGFCRWAFDAIPQMRRIDAGCFGFNAGSARVLAKAGFALEGTRRLCVEKNGVMTDAKLFGLLREECPGVRSATVTGTLEEELAKKEEEEGKKVK
ncbi:uncharacterized protein E0L32_003633 [Thyridium curvatum]|uniref:N-acetyltransferase domain-containing protein n=1 Tax=Thyridium curvatum TaxID=1093900 RepID=A0A507B365_9PEZI|nr:uncharacterized protein E0L32_003633 [Thyridium curvatum]TPX16692.1 hypothetical protein E0L32_003633 [Thyridium curvatum]